MAQSSHGWSSAGQIRPKLDRTVPLTLEINLLQPHFCFPPPFLKKDLLGSESCGSCTFPGAMGFPRTRNFTATSESVRIRNVFFPSAIALHQNTSPGDSVSSQNSSDFTLQWVDTQNSVSSKLEKLLLAGKRVISLPGRRRWKDSPMLWGQGDRGPGADAGKWNPKRN